MVNYTSKHWLTTPW